MDRLAGIREREQAATKGPWLPDAWEFDLEREIGLRIRKGDAAFVAHAREDVPWLLARLDEAEEALREIERMGDYNFKPHEFAAFARRVLSGGVPADEPAEHSGVASGSVSTHGSLKGEVDDA